MGTSVWKTAALALAAAALPLTAAPAAASQAVSRVTVRVLPLDALLLRQRAALSAPAPLDLLHRSEADLKVTAECLGAGRLSLSVSGSAPASLCGPEDGGTGRTALAVYSQIASMAARRREISYAASGSDAATTFTVTFTSLDQ